MFRDIRIALRSLTKNRGPAAIACLVLAVGIGANTIVFCLVHGLLLGPLEFQQPDRLVRIFGVQADRGNDRQRLPEVAVAALRQLAPEEATQGDLAPETVGGSASAPFSAVAGAFNMGLSITDAERPLNPLMRRVSSGWLELLGVTPHLGRTFLAEEHQQGAKVALLSHGLWQRLYGADPKIVGKTLDLAYEPYTVVGVMPATFRNPSFPVEPELWLPLAETAAPDVGSSNFVVHGRLAPGVELEAAGRAIARTADDLEAAYPTRLQGWSMRVVPLRRALTETIRPALMVLVAAVGLVLLIACGNVANLLLARAIGRRQEMAVRQALGAGRRHLVRQLLAESLILSLVGCGLGVLGAFWGLGPLLAMAPSNTPVPLLDTLEIQPAVLGFSLALALLTTLIFGFLPLVQLFRRSGDLLSAGAVRSLGDRSGHRLRSTLVVAELALSMVLLTSAALMTQTLWNLQGLGLGFEPEGRLAGRIGARGPGIDSPSSFEPFHRQALDKIRQLPGVAQVGGVEFLPMFAGGFGTSTPVAPADRQIEPEARPRASLLAATPDYFDAYGHSLLRGRAFDSRDRADSEPVAVISANLAERLWGTDDPVDRLLRVGDGEEAQSVRIVGLAGDLRGLANNPEPPPILFRPLTQRPASNITFFLRAEEGEASLLARIPAIEDAVWSVSRDAPVYNISTLGQIVRDLEWQPRFMMQLLFGFALLALVLAASGIYAVLAFAVAERTREIGARVALGATRAHILRMVVRDALRLATAGVGIGILGSLAAGRLLSGQLLGVAPTDPWTHGSLGIILMLIALGASLVPALRATRVDPMEALRCD